MRCRCLGLLTALAETLLLAPLLCAESVKAPVEDVARPSAVVETAPEKKLIENPDFGVIETYSNGACSTEVPLCSRLGVRKLLDGGNAMDAAVAAAICVGTINSFSSGIGGGGFLLIKKPGREEALDMIDFRETAPESLSVGHLSSQIDRAKMGGLAVGVPGEIRGLYEAHRKYGRLSWKSLFPENIEIAHGFLASAQLVKRINRLRLYIMEDPGLKATYTRDGELLKEGDMVVRENYARTLGKVMNDPESFYSGDLAKSVAAAVRSKGGVLSEKDLRGYKAIHRPVLEGRYHGYRVYTTNLPTSGALIIEALNILEKYNLKRLEAESMQQGRFRHFHLLVEVFKFVMARRGELSDPAFLPGWEEIVREITSKETAEKIHRKIDLGGILDAGEYGMKRDATEDHGTTHINVIDKDDMAVLLTSTVNLEFGAKFMDPETGIVFNNQIDDFYVPSAADAFSSRTPANIAEPGKRPFSSASPILLEKDSEILMLGAAGGVRIPTSVIAVLFYLSTGRNLKEAITATRIHNQLQPDTTFVEYNISKKLEQYFVSSGHRTEKSLQNSIFTSVQGILLRRDRAGNRMIHAVSDPRKGGEAFGY